MKRSLLLLFVAATAVAAGLQYRPASAATTELLVSQVCMADGRVQVTFEWRGNNPSASQQWLDLSLFDNGWGAGTFIGAGPFPSAAQRFAWTGLLAGRTHYTRVNQLVGSAWDPSATFVFDTVACGSASTPPTMTTEKVLAPIVSVSFTRTGPGNYTANVKVGLPNGCHKPAGYEMNTALTIVRIQIYNEVPVGPVTCTQVFGTYDLKIDLPRNLTIGEWWRVDINRNIFGFTAE